MPNQERVPKGGRNVERGNRHRKRVQAERMDKIKRARERHLKNALRSCGPEFMEKLQLFYARIGLLNAPKKCRRAREEAR